MRKWNALISAGALALFLIHMIAGIFQLTGFLPGGQTLLQALTGIMTFLVAAHAVIAVKLTADTLKALKRAGRSYFRENTVFWARRISGLCLMAMMPVHAAVFSGRGGEAYRLPVFEGPQLAAGLILVLSLAVHILSNIRPLLISFGIAGFRIYVKDVLFVLAVVLAVAAAAFVIYYLRWNVLWRP